MPEMLSEHIRTDYRRLTTECGFVVLENRTLIRFSGNDRQSFLHNFCTADVKNLKPGHLNEAFILNSKGKLLGEVFLVASDNQLMLSTVAGQFDSLFGHLDKYIIREDVQLVDVSDESTTMFVCGPLAKTRLSQLCGSLPAENQVVAFEFEGQMAELSQLELAGMGFMLIIPRAVQASCEERLREIGILPCSSEALEIIRIDCATPWFGIDASDSNLPQELCRDKKAISFNKGCYLGQETVARIDAIGHVNRLFVSFRLAGKVAAGTVLMSGDKEVGRLTSVCWSPGEDSWIGLGFLKRSLCKKGNEVRADDVIAKVEMK